MQEAAQRQSNQLGRGGKDELNPAAMLPRFFPQVVHQHSTVSKACTVLCCMSLSIRGVGLSHDISQRLFAVNRFTTRSLSDRILLT